MASEYDALLAEPAKKSEYDALLASAPTVQSGPQLAVGSHFPVETVDRPTGFLQKAGQFVSELPAKVFGGGREALTQPVVELPRVPAQEGTIPQIAAGAANIPIDIANFALSPVGVGTFGATAVSSPAMRLAAGILFGGEAAKQAVEAPTLQEKVTAGGTALAIGAGTAADAFMSRRAAAGEKAAVEEPTAPATQARPEDVLADYAKQTATKEVAPETKLPDWAREEMVNRGLDPNRPLNDIDIQNPSVREAVIQDPTLTAEQKSEVLKTGSAEPPKEVIPSATEKGQITEGDLTEHPGDETRGTPGEPVSSGGNAPSGEVAPTQEAVTSPEYQAASQQADVATREFRAVQEQYRQGKIGDEEFLAAKATHDQAQAAFDKAFTAEQNKTAPEKPPAPDVVQPTELFTPKEIPFNLRGEEPPPEIGPEGAARAKAQAGYEQEKAQMQFGEEPSPAEQARMQREYEQELTGQFEEHMAKGGDELVDAVKSLGGLNPESPHFGDLQESFRERQKYGKQAKTKLVSGEDVKFGDIFKKEAIGDDQLVRELQAKGFDVENPGQLAEMLDERLRTGKKVFGMEARAAESGITGLPGYEMGIVPRPSPFVRQDIAPIVQKAADGLRFIRNLFSPASAGKLADVTAGIIREHAGDLARKHEIAVEALNGARKLFARTPDAVNHDVIDKLETGQNVSGMGLQDYKDARQKLYEQKIAEVQAVSPNALQNVIEDYFPHIWTRESVEKLQNKLQTNPNAVPDNPWSRVFGKRPLAGPASFLKKRTIPTVKEGLDLGLELVTNNPVDLDILKMGEMDKYVMGQKIMQEMKDRGAKFVSAGDRPDPGYEPINDKIARVFAPRDWKIVDQAGNQMPGVKLLGNYYAPADAARVINNYLSPGLRGNPIYDAFRFVGNSMNQVQLGISLYHAMFTAIDAATSSHALGLEQIARSGGSPSEIAKGALNIAKAYAEAPIAGGLIENLWRGNKFLKEYSKPGSTNAELAKIVDAAVAGGTRIRMDRFYNTGAVDSFFKAFNTGNYTGAVLRAPFAVLQTLAKPLMEQAVPRMKAGITSQMLQYELSKLPANASREDVRTVAQRVVDSVDNRMGQMIYDNLFWNKNLKDLLMASVRSVGWNVGDIRELGGGALDTLTAPKRAYQAMKGQTGPASNPVVTHKMAYAFSLPIVVGVLGAMYQYLKTGQGPQNLQDYFMPRTGRINPDGSPERVMLPTYMKDVYPLALAAGQRGVVGLVKRGYQMAINKTHPAISTISQMLQNKDYYGNQIVAPDDSLVNTVRGESAYVAKQFQPFSFRGISQREGGPAAKAESIIGIMPASRELTRTPAEELMHEIYLRKRPEGGYTASEQAKRDLRRQAQKGIDIRPDLFKGLSRGDRARVLNVATPDESRVFQSGIKPKSFTAPPRGQKKKFLGR